MDVLQATQGAGEQTPCGALGQGAMLQDLVEKISARSNIEDHGKPNCLNLAEPKDPPVADDVLVLLHVEKCCHLALDRVKANSCVHLLHRNRRAVPAKHALDGGVGPLADDAVAVSGGGEGLVQIGAKTPEIAQRIQNVLAGLDSSTEDEPSRGRCLVAALASLPSPGSTEPGIRRRRHKGYDDQVKRARQLGAGDVGKEERCQRMRDLLARLHAKLRFPGAAGQTEWVGCVRGRGECLG
mmetsp:Transcript_84639/g.189048  ORF Transcript_84639/g.189048 Transcript_84639/m.189048 type:complete len:240 (+) Transcript_84639:734-1453(+)